MNEGIYSNDKMVWHYARDGKLPDVPKQVELILSDLCNQDCHFCAFRLSNYTNSDFAKGVKLAKFGTNNPVRMIPHERALSLVDEIARAGVDAIQFTGGGEPTVHPHHEEVFERALKSGLKCALVSNGLKWSDNLMYHILPQFAWVRVSIDAGKEESYSKIRSTNPANFEKVLRCVKKLSAEIKRQNTPCVLGIGFVVTPENWQEIVKGVAVAKRTGAAYIRLSAFFSPDDADPFEDFWKQAKELIVIAKKEYEDDTFKVHDLFGDRLQDLIDGRPDFKTCSYQFYTHFVGGDMKGYRCCVTSYSNHGFIDGADYSKVAFDEYWKSDKRKQDMEKFRAWSCLRCQFSDKNRRMQYMLDTNPVHREFP